MTSSYFKPSSLSTMCERCAQGQRWFVYNVILGVSPFETFAIFSMTYVVCVGENYCGVARSEISLSDANVSPQMAVVLCYNKSSPFGHQ